jgi:hypothetical protein
MLNLNRRALMVGAAASFVPLEEAIGATGVPDTCEVPAAELLVPQSQIGRFKVTALADGYSDMPYAYFPGRTADQIEMLARA